MFHKENKSIPIEDLLKDIDGLNINPDVANLIRNFIKQHAPGATGLMIAWTYGEHADVDATKMSEAEVVWLGHKIIDSALNKRIKFL